jgi:hypothetical protein
MVVFKYKLDFSRKGMAYVQAPPGQFLKTAVVDGSFFVWILHDEEQPRVTWCFRAVMTGEDLDPNFPNVWTYLDTVFKDGLVIHLFRPEA